jgi:precorrin-3B synthase
LGPADPAADDGRNVLVSPTAGIDPRQRLDVQPLARALLALLAEPRHRGLSPKFSILLDGGEAVAATDHPHDIWLAAMSPDVFALGLACAPPGDAAPVATIAATHVVDAVADLLARFLAAAARDPAIKRMRHAPVTLAAHGHATWQRRAPAPYRHLGVQAQRQPDRAYVGAMPPLGRLSPAILTELAALAGATGDDIRLTPWRSVLLASVPAAMTASVVQRLEGVGLVCDPDHPVASLIACAGAPGCSAGLADTKADALRLARALGPEGVRRRSIHLSGCAKSCAVPGAADWTLVATAPGTYDLFRAAPDAPSRFGTRVAGDLSLDDAARHLADA